MASAAAPTACMYAGIAPRAKQDAPSMKSEAMAVFRRAGSARTLTQNSVAGTRVVCPGRRLWTWCRSIAGSNNRAAPLPARPGGWLLLAGVSCRTSENLHSWPNIVPLPPLFHYSDESAAGVEKGEKVRFIVLEDVKGQTVTMFVSRRTAAVGKGIPAVTRTSRRRRLSGARNARSEDRIIHGSLIMEPMSRDSCLSSKG